MNFFLQPLTVSFLLLTSIESMAAITPFSEDYEGLAGTGPWSYLNLTSRGWRSGVNVFGGIPYPDGSDDRGVWHYFYNFIPPPDTTTLPITYPSQILNEETDKNGGATKYLNVFSDYNNYMTHSSPFLSVNTLLLKEFVIDAVDIGKTVTFTFDAKRPKAIDDGFGGDSSQAVGNGCTYACTAGAFLKTIDPSNNYSQTNYITLDTSYISQSSWENFSITLNLASPLFDGQLLQVGFENFATNFENTSVYYDNVNLEISDVPLPAGIYLFLSGLVGLGLMRDRNA